MMHFAIMYFGFVLKKNQKTYTRFIVTQVTIQLNVVTTKYSYN